MSRPRALPSPAARAIRAAPTAPPAGPERTLQAPARAASATSATPPEERMTTGRGNPALRGGVGERAEVAPQQRREVGVDRRRRAALVLAEAGQDLVRGGDVDARQLAPQALGDAPARAPGPGRRRAGRSPPIRRRSRGPGPPGAPARRRPSPRRRPPGRPARPPRSAAPARPAAAGFGAQSRYSSGRSWRPISSRSAKPLVAISAVRAPRSSSRALVPTVIPWAKDSTAPASRPARRSTSSTAAITPADWSSGVVGSFAVWTDSPSSRTASVKVPPTSTPSSMRRSYRAQRQSSRRVAPSGPRTMWTPSSSGSIPGWSAPQVAAARLAALQRRGGDRRRERVGVAAQLHQPSRVAAAGRPAARPPRGSPRLGGSKRHSGGAGRLARGDLCQRRRRGAAAEHEALAERVRGEPVGAVQAGAGALADGVEAGQRGAALEVDRDPAHRVVGGGGDRDRLRARVEARLGERGEDAGEAGGVDLPQVELDVGGAVGLIRSRIAAVTASRGASSSVKRRAGGVEQRRALAADRLGDQGAVEARCRAGRARSGGTGRTRGRRGRRRPPPRAPGRRRSRRAGWWCGCQSAAAPPVARTVAAAAIGPASVTPRGSARRRSTAPSPRSARAPRSAARRRPSPPASR